MSIGLGATHIEEVELGGPIPPEGHHVYYRDTDNEYISDGNSLTLIGTGGGAYTDEQAQDAVGGIVDSTLTYNDATPSIGVADDGITYAKIQNVTDNRLLGRSAGSAGDVQEITTGSGLSLASGVLSSNRIYGLLDVKPTVDAPDDEFDAGALDGKWTVVSGSSGTVALNSAGTTLQVYDLASRSSWLMLQVGRNTGHSVFLRQDYTLPDGNSIITLNSHSPGSTSAGVSVNNGSNLLFGVNDNDTSITSGVYAHIQIDCESASFSRMYITSSVGSDILGPGFIYGGLIYLRISRVGLVYNFYCCNNAASNWIFLGSKTLGSAATNVWIGAACSATLSGPAPIQGLDWIRLGTNDMDPW